MSYDPPSLLRRRPSRFFTALRRFGAVYVTLLVAAGTFVTGFFYGQENGRAEAAHLPTKDRLIRILNLNSLSPPLEQNVDFRLFWDVWNSIKENAYKQPVVDRDLFYGAISGMVGALQDPYSVFLEPATATQFGEELQGRLEGIGAEIGIKKDELRIISPLPDSPAERAGLRAGDHILAINQEDTAGMGVDVAVSKIRGAKGTKVTLVVRRGGGESFTVVITRAAIVVRSVRTSLVTTPQGKKVARFEVRQFSQETPALFDQEARRALGERPVGIILDLRNNPGGYLDAAVDMAGLWIKDNTVLLERDSKGVSEEISTHGSGILEKIPTVILVNEGSASASEILAGALQDHGLAHVVGQKSFGKGSVQDLKELSDGSALKLTIAHWLTPKGREIQDQGITPDVVVEYTADDYNEDRDQQLQKALELFDAPSAS